MSIFKREPARIIGAIMALIALAIGFGLHISGMQVDLIEKFLLALLPLVAAEITRTQVFAEPTVRKIAKEGIDSPKDTKVETVLATVAAEEAMK